MTGASSRHSLYTALVVLWQLRGSNCGCLQRSGLLHPSRHSAKGGQSDHPVWPRHPPRLGAAVRARWHGHERAGAWESRRHHQAGRARQRSS